MRYVNGAIQDIHLAQYLITELSKNVDFKLLMYESS